MDALSEPFERQIVIDDTNDVIGLRNEISMFDQHDYLDIKYVTYSSDGETLDFSIWLKNNLGGNDFQPPLFMASELIQI